MVALRMIQTTFSIRTQVERIQVATMMNAQRTWNRLSGNRAYRRSSCQVYSTSLAQIVHLSKNLWKNFKKTFDVVLRAHQGSARRQKKLAVPKKCLHHLRPRPKLFQVHVQWASLLFQSNMKSRKLAKGDSRHAKILFRHRDVLQSVKPCSHRTNWDI